MTDREAPAASRVRAADVVLHTAFRGMQIEAGVSESTFGSMLWSSRRNGLNGEEGTE